MAAAAAQPAESVPPWGRVPSRLEAAKLRLTLAKCLQHRLGDACVLASAPQLDAEVLGVVAALIPELVVLTGGLYVYEDTVSSLAILGRIPVTGNTEDNSGDRNFSMIRFERSSGSSASALPPAEMAAPAAAPASGGTGLVASCVAISGPYYDTAELVATVLRWFNHEDQSAPGSGVVTYDETRTLRFTTINKHGDTTRGVRYFGRVSADGQSLELDSESEINGHKSFGRAFTFFECEAANMDMSMHPDRHRPQVAD